MRVGTEWYQVCERCHIREGNAHNTLVFRGNSGLFYARTSRTAAGKPCKVSAAEALNRFRSRRNSRRRTPRIAIRRKWRRGRLDWCARQETLRASRSEARTAPPVESQSVPSLHRWPPDRGVAESVRAYPFPLTLTPVATSRS